MAEYAFLRSKNAGPIDVRKTHTSLAELGFGPMAVTFTGHTDPYIIVVRTVAPVEDYTKLKAVVDSATA